MFWLFPLLLKAILISSVTMVTIGAFAVAIDTIISRLTVKEVMKQKGLKSVLVKTVNRTSNIVTLEDLNNDDIWEIRGTDVDYDIQKGVRITI